MRHYIVLFDQDFHHEPQQLHHLLVAAELAAFNRAILQSRYALNCIRGGIFIRVQNLFIEACLRPIDRIA